MKPFGLLLLAIVAALFVLAVVLPWLMDRPALDVKVSSRPDTFTQGGRPPKVVYLLIKPIGPFSLIDISSDDTALYAFEPEASLSLCGREMDTHFIESVAAAWGPKYGLSGAPADDGRPLATKIRVYSEELAVYGEVPPSLIEVSYHTGRTRIIEAVLSGGRVPDDSGEMLELLSFRFKNSSWPGSSLALFSRNGGVGRVAASFDGQGGEIYSSPDLSVMLSRPVESATNLTPALNPCFGMKLGGNSTGPRQGAGILHDPLLSEQSILDVAEINASNYIQIRNSSELSGRILVQAGYVKVRGIVGFVEHGEQQQAIFEDTAIEIAGDYSVAMNMPDGTVQISGHADSIRINGRELVNRRLDSYLPTDAKSWIWMGLSIIFALVIEQSLRQVVRRKRDPSKS